jgi:vacuolar-type H+-ATPase subunit H
MEDALKKLLEAELRADAEVAHASAERERTIQEALDQARRAESQFVAGIDELRGPYVKQAEERAATAIAELRRKYDERGRGLRAQAEARESAAVEAALAVVLDPKRN